MNINMYTWNPNDPCFEWKRPCFGGLNHQNRGQTGSRYINMQKRIRYLQHSPSLDGTKPSTGHTPARCHGGALGNLGGALPDVGHPGVSPKNHRCFGSLRPSKIWGIPPPNLKEKHIWTTKTTGFLQLVVVLEHIHSGIINRCSIKKIHHKRDGFILLNLVEC